MASWSGDGSAWIIERASDLQHRAVRTYENELVEMVDKMIKGTPVGIDGGRLKSNWQIAPRVNQNHLKTKNGAATKSGFAAKRIKGKLATLRNGKLLRVKDKELFLFNNSPYGNVVEFGGYPTPVEKGTWNKYTKRYEKRSFKGFSKQAPVGMFRRNIRLFNSIIKRRV